MAHRATLPQRTTAPSRDFGCLWFVLPEICVDEVSQQFLDDGTAHIMSSLREQQRSNLGYSILARKSAPRPSARAVKPLFSTQRTLAMAHNNRLRRNCDFCVAHGCRIGSVHTRRKWASPRGMGSVQSAQPIDAVCGRLTQRSAERPPPYQLGLGFIKARGNPLVRLPRVGLFY